jgi:hypothetical protein
MNKYAHLTKLAKKLTRKQRKERRKVIGDVLVKPSLALSGAALGLGSLATGRLPQRVQGMMPKEVKATNPLYEKIAPEMYELFGGDLSKIPSYGGISRFKISPLPFEFANAAYSPIFNKILSNHPNPREGILAHELGHALSHQNIKGLTGATIGSKLLSGMAGLGSLLHTVHKAQKATRPEDLSYAAPIAASATTLPILADEAMASAKALKYLTHVHGLKGGLLKALPLLPAFGSYLVGASSPIIGNYMARRYVEKKSPTYKLKSLLGM